MPHGQFVNLTTGISNMTPEQDNGNCSVTHAVARGESLSLIAPKYGFPQWRPIWNFNTKVHRVLGPNPDLIPAGARIFIPRTLQGYENMIRKLRSLKDQMAAEGDKLKFELEAEHYKHKGSRVLFDLAGDVETLIGTVALKAAQAARAAKTASAATGNAKIAAQYLADREAERLSQELKQALKDKAVNGLLTKADEDLGTAHNDLYLTQKKGIEAIRGVSLQGGKSFLDIADLLLDYVTVSSVADGMIVLWVGETPGKTYEQAQQAIPDSVSASQHRWEEKIREITRERDLVFNNLPG